MKGPRIRAVSEHSAERNADRGDKPNVAIAGWFVKGVVGELFLRDCVSILEPICDRIYVITSEHFSYGDSVNVNVLRLPDVKFSNRIGLLARIARFLAVQWRVTISLIGISKHIDIVISPLGGTSGEGHFVPTIVAKLLGKKVIVFHRGGRKIHDVKLGDPTIPGRIISPPIIAALQRITYAMADRIAVQGQSIITWAGLSKYENKISVGSARYVDTELFTPKKDIEERKRLVGFCGRFRPVKGVMDFVDAIPLVLRERDDVEFLIAGGGPLFEKIKDKLASAECYRKVQLDEWISHEDKLPAYLNELKLLVLPSYSEGLPGIVVEAMACGTPVLATPVGAVPDIMEDGETGFIIEDNSPQCIAKGIIRVLDHQNLKQIVQNARSVVEKEFSYEAAVERHATLLSDLGTRRCKKGNS